MRQDSPDGAFYHSVLALHQNRFAVAQVCEPVPEPQRRLAAHRFATLCYILPLYRVAICADTCWRSARIGQCSLVLVVYMIALRTTLHRIDARVDCLAFCADFC
jgi:hypothetical protein